jgi:hypothetical protein
LSLTPLSAKGPISSPVEQAVEMPQLTIAEMIKQVPEGRRRRSNARLTILAKNAFSGCGKIGITVRAGLSG